MDSNHLAYFEISPVHRSKATMTSEVQEELPVLRLTQFTHFPKLSFGDINFGNVGKKKLLILNPKDQIQKVFCEKYPSRDNGFYISPMEASIAPGESIEISLSWNPKSEGRMRELIHWKSSLGVRSQTVLLGSCVKSKPVKVKRARVIEENRPVKYPLGLHNFHRERKSQKAASGIENKTPSILNESSINRSEYKVDVAHKTRNKTLDINDKTYVEKCTDVLQNANSSESSVCGKYFKSGKERKIEIVVNSSYENAQHSSNIPRDLWNAECARENLSLDINLSSPARRQTYVKHPENDKDFSHIFEKDQQNDELLNYIKSKNEGFFKCAPSDGNSLINNKPENKLKICDNFMYYSDTSKKSFEDNFLLMTEFKSQCVEDSPSRRYTFIKKNISDVADVENNLVDKNDIDCISTSSEFHDSKRFSEHDVSLSEDSTNTNKISLQTSSKIEASCKISLEISDDEEFEVDQNNFESVLSKEQYLKLEEKNYIVDCIPKESKPDLNSTLNDTFDCKFDLDCQVNEDSEAFEVPSNKSMINTSPKVPISEPSLPNSSKANITEKMLPNYNFLPTSISTKLFTSSQENDFKELNNLIDTVEETNINIIVQTNSGAVQRLKSDVLTHHTEGSVATLSNEQSVTLQKSRKSVHLNLTKEKYTIQTSRKKYLNISRLNNLSIKPQNMDTKARQNPCPISCWNKVNGIQLSVLVKWLNFVLIPNEEGVIEKDDFSKLHMKSQSLYTKTKNVPSRDSISFRVYTACRRLNKLRWKACMLFQDPVISLVIAKLEMAIEKKLLTMRLDRQSHVDVGLKQEMVKLMLSYNPLWLRIGLETVYGEVICLSSNSDLEGIVRFIMARVLNCPNISKKFAHPTVPYSYKKEYEAEMKKFQLKQFLILVYFLDQAKTFRLIDYDPCLFDKQSTIKKSKDVLYAFAREFLSGVGDIIKHLGYMGYVVSHEQTHLDEFDYSVTNICTDLRCGTRLARVVEILSQKFRLSKQMRLPAVSRLQKIHNTKVVLNAVQQMQIVNKEGEYAAKDIVDGHLEKTCSLLWDLILNIQIKYILTADRLLEEIRYLRNTYSMKSCLNRNISTVKDVENMSFEHCISASPSNRTNNIYELLIIWIQLVCAHYNVQVKDMTVSFSDGRVFCLLLHHYHSHLLQMKKIQFETTKNCLSSDCSCDSNLKSCCNHSQNDFALKIKNEKANFDLFISKVNEIGGVPMLIQPEDYMNTIPDEKITKTFVSYLCARLLDLSTEIKAARIIQLAWRKRMNKINQKLIKKQNNAALMIQAWWRAIFVQKQNVAFLRATIVIQSHWRKRKAQIQLKELKNKYAIYLKNKEAEVVRTIEETASVIIQKNVRMFIYRRRFIKVKNSIIKIQSLSRTWKVSNDFKKNKLSAIKIQKWWRNVLEKKNSHQIQMISAILIQSSWRRYNIRKQFLQLRHATMRIQASVRRMIIRNQYKRTRIAIVTLQKKFRCWCLVKRERNKFLSMRISAIRIQSTFRGWLERKKYLQIYTNIVLIQSHIRMSMCRRKFNTVKWAVLIIQRRFRFFKSVREKKKQEERAAVIIQSTFRGYSYRKIFSRQKSACLIIQNCFRKYVCQKNYLKNLNAASLIKTSWQSYLLMKKERSIYLKKKESSIRIQRYWRRFMNMRERSAIIIQSNFKGYLARKQYRSLLENHISLMKTSNEKHVAAMTIQRCYKKWKKEQDEQKGCDNAINMQMFWQSHTDQNSTALDSSPRHKAAVKIQAVVRMYIARKTFLKKLNAARFIQARWRTHMVKNNSLEQFDSKRTIKNVTNFIVSERDTLEHAKEKNNSALFIHHNCQYNISFQGYNINHVLVIQNWWRSKLLSFRLQKEIKSKREAAIVIQKWFRSVSKKSSKQIQNESASKLQSLWKMILSKRLYIMKKNKAIIIQRWWRQYLKAKLHSQNIDTERNLVLLQAHIRGYLMRLKVNEVQIKISDDYVDKSKDCLLIQTWWRAKKARRDFLEKKNAVIKLQRYWRSAVDMLIAREYFIYLRRASIILQAAWRAKVARKQFANMIAERTIRNIQSQQNIHDSAIVIQSVWRGYSIRQKLRANRRITKIRGRLREATTKVCEKDKIGNKTEFAINNLAHYKDLKSTLIAVMILDSSTRLSSVCCEMVCAGKTVNILIFLLDSCNRSIPHMQILTYVLNTFITLAKFPKVLPKIQTLPDLIPLVMRLMKIYYDKGSPIFIKSSSLLYILLSTSPSLINDANVILKDICYLQVGFRRKNPQAAKKCSSSSNMILPSLTSEWLMKPKEMREFSEPLSALLTLNNKIQKFVAIKK